MICIQTASPFVPFISLTMVKFVNRNWREAFQTFELNVRKIWSQNIRKRDTCAIRYRKLMWPTFRKDCKTPINVLRHPWSTRQAHKKLSTRKANCLQQNFWMNDQSLSGLTTSHGDLLHNLFEDLWSGIPVRFNNCTYTSVRSPSLTSTLAMWNLQVVTNLCCSSHVQQHYCTCLASS